MLRWLYLIALGAAGALFIRSCLFEGIVIASGSMEPTLAVGHHAFVNRFVYKLSKPKRGDVVVFPSPVADKDMVKRVIAVEGDVVAIKDKGLYINGVLAVEPYVQHTRPNENLKGDNIEPRTVPRGAVFVMGDNRDESGDSRDWIDAKTGEHIYFIPVENLKGKVMGVP